MNKAKILHTYTHTNIYICVCVRIVSFILFTDCRKCKTKSLWSTALCVHSVYTGSITDIGHTFLPTINNINLIHNN